MLIPLPHTAGCLACGRDNAHGLHLDLSVDVESGVVRTNYAPLSEHIGFTGIAHGGILATVFDEAMVWAATWSGRRFCYCAEMTVRFRKPAGVGDSLSVEASVMTARGKLITTTAVMRDGSGAVVAESTGKYMPMPVQQHLLVYRTLIDDGKNAEAMERLAVT